MMCHTMQGVLRNFKVIDVYHSDLIGVMDGYTHVRIVKNRHGHDKHMSLPEFVDLASRRRNCMLILELNDSPVVTRLMTLRS